MKQFRHYCEKCEYLGSVPGSDFYVCRPGGVYGTGTMLVRKSDEDSDYQSFPPGYVPDYGPADAASDYGIASVALHKLANALLEYHDKRGRF